MAVNAATINVTIRKEAGNPARCLADDIFEAQRGDIVVFHFDEKDAEITFIGDSPFDAVTFAPGRQTVRGDAREGGYAYTITWAGKAGHGNAGGRVRGSGQ